MFSYLIHRTLCKNPTVFSDERTAGLHGMGRFLFNLSPSLTKMLMLFLSGGKTVVWRGCIVNRTRLSCTHFPERSFCPKEVASFEDKAASYLPTVLKDIDKRHEKLYFTQFFHDGVYSRF